MSQLPSRIPPYSQEAEQCVLGALMLDNRAWDKVIEHVSEDDFYREEHRLIFQTIVRLVDRRQPFDVIMISDLLKEQNLVERIGGEAYLFELAQNTPSSANAAAYAQIVRERSILRQLITTGSDVVDSAFQPKGREIQSILEEAERRIFEIAARRSRGLGPVNISSILAKAMDRIDTLYRSGSSMTGVSSGFYDLDRMTSGLQAGDLIIVAGRPSMGKTVLGVNIAEHVAVKEKKAVLIFSMEMPSEQLAMRMISSLGRVDQHRVRTGKLTDEDWPRITSAISMLSESQLFIDDTPSLTPQEVRSRARRVATDHPNLGLIVIDYLQLMQISNSRENRTTEISEISRSLKALAKELNLPLIAISQLNRSLEHRNDRRPVMSDLRESGSIEQDADLIAFIYRDEVYNADTPDKGIAEIIIRKQRNGPIGDIRVKFDAQFTQFRNLSHEEAAGGFYNQGGGVAQVPWSNSEDRR